MANPNACANPEVLAGYHQFQNDDGESYGSFEVFWSEGEHQHQESGEPFEIGWYWWPCFPGCLPDGEPIGPFENSVQAYSDAQS